MRRLILVPVLIFLALAAIGAGIGYWIYNNYTYYSTDDAQVSGQIVSVSAPASGQLTNLSVRQGDSVTQDQTIGTIILAGTGAKSPATVDLTSPINGTILQTTAVQGQNVVPGLTVVQLTDLKSVNVTAYVDEGAIDNVKVGQDVDVHIDAYSGTSFTGKVQRIVMATAGQFSLLPTQDNASSNFTKVGQRIPVVISLDPTSGKTIMPGMSVSVTIHIH